jgi:hypothetical protein
MSFFSSLDAFAVCLARQWASGTVFGHPTLRGRIIQKIEAENADVNCSPFSVDQRPGKVSLTDFASPMKEWAALDRDLLLKPQMSGREMILLHSHLLRFLERRLTPRSRLLQPVEQPEPIVGNGPF